MCVCVCVCECVGGGGAVNADNALVCFLQRYSHGVCCTQPAEPRAWCHYECLHTHTHAHTCKTLPTEVLKFAPPVLSFCASASQ